MEKSNNVDVRTLHIMKAAFMAGNSFAKVHEKTFGSMPDKKQMEAGWNMFCDTTFKTVLKK